MSKLRNSAKGQQCQVRIPGVCNYDPDTVVLAHFRMPGDGMGRKPSDTRGAYACSACHNEVDWRTSDSDLTRVETALAFAQGVFRTQDIMIADGLIEVKK